MPRHDTHAAGQQRSKHAATIHRKCRNQVEEQEIHVDVHQQREEGPGRIEITQSCVVPAQANDGVEDHRDCCGHCRARQGNQELLLRLIRDALEASNTADGKQDDIGSAHAESARHGDVPELVKEDASEDCKEPERRGERAGWFRPPDTRPPPTRSETART